MADFCCTSRRASLRISCGRARRRARQLDRHLRPHPLPAALQLEEHSPPRPSSSHAISSRLLPRQHRRALEQARPPLLAAGLPLLVQAEPQLQAAATQPSSMH